MEVKVQRSDKLFRVDYNTKLGRHLVAVRDIEIGEVILDDYPLVLGPSTFIDPSRKDTNSIQISVCPTCYTKLTTRSATDTDKNVKVESEKERIESRENESENSESDNFVCSKCGLTLCSKVCSEENIHVQNECQIFHKDPSLYSALENIRDLHQFITTIRCLFYRIRDPIKWVQLKELQGSVQVFQSMGVFDGIGKAFSLLSWNYFENTEDAGASNSLDTIKEEIKEDITSTARLCLGVLRTNAFSRISSKISIECLYFFSSLMAHNCLMNTDRYFDMDGVRLITRAASRIRTGQPITTTYLSHLNNNIERQREMKSVWNFSCDCERCLDPTECGTFLSTIACPSCNSSTLNPHMISNSDNYTWICEYQACGRILSAIDAESHLQSTIGLVENEQPDITDLKATENWLIRFDNDKFLHSNHSLFIQVKLYLCQEYGSGRGISSLSDEQLLRKKRLCGEVLKVLDKLLRGVFLVKGVVLFELWLALYEIRTRGERKNVDAFMVSDELIQNVALLAKEVLQHGSRNSAEKLMFNILQENEPSSDTQTSN